MLPLFIFATKLEAETLCSLIEFTQINENLWQSEACYLLICGMGALEACYEFNKTLNEIPKPSHIFNMGCTANLSHFEAFDCIEVVQVSKCLERGQVDDHSRLFFEKLFPVLETFTAPLEMNLPSARLISVDCPLHDTETRLRISRLADALDMEGYGLTYAAKKAGFELHIIKCISDHAKDAGQEGLRKNLARCSQELASIALTWLSARGLIRSEKDRMLKTSS